MRKTRGVSFSFCPFAGIVVKYKSGPVSVFEKILTAHFINLENHSKLQRIKRMFDKL